MHVRQLVIGSFAGTCLTACSGGTTRGGASDSGEVVVIDTDSGGGSGEIYLDIGDGVDGGGEANPDCTDPSGNSEAAYKFSVLWVANSREGSVSKIDTISATELARYYTGPDRGDGISVQSPSRTSVNLVGDVVVGNRQDHGQSSFTKVLGDSDSCFDRNGDGAINTSTGPTDLLAWGEDECVDWNYVVEGNSARAVAWDAGEITHCGVSEDPHVWVGFRDWNNVATVHLLDNHANVVAEVPIPQSGSSYGLYGGAVDGEGNFWGQAGDFARVDRETFEVTMHPGGGYGITMDKYGNPWGPWGSGRAVKYDVASDELVFHNGAISGYDRGVAIDAEDQLWLVANGPCGIARLDTEAGVWVDPSITYPGCEEPVGVSIDFEGHVWVVDRVAEKAVKLKPNAAGQGVEVIAEVTGLVEPYTYSDMTGAMLNLVVNPPVG